MEMEANIKQSKCAGIEIFSTSAVLCALFVNVSITSASQQDLALSSHPTCLLFPLSSQPMWLHPIRTGCSTNVTKTDSKRRTVLHLPILLLKSHYASWLAKRDLRLWSNRPPPKAERVWWGWGREDDITLLTLLIRWWAFVRIVS